MLHISFKLQVLQPKLSRCKSGFPVLVLFFNGYVFKLQKTARQTERLTDQRFLHCRLTMCLLFFLLPTPAATRPRHRTNRATQRNMATTVRTIQSLAINLHCSRYSHVDVPTCQLRFSVIKICKRLAVISAFLFLIVGIHSCSHLFAIVLLLCPRQHVFLNSFVALIQFCKITLKVETNFMNLVL